MPTINEIARMASVSPATVSKVINNRAYVSAATRARVERVIAETGFVPSQRARWLSTRRTLILGLLIPYTSDQLFADPHLIEIMRGIEAEANLHEYNLLLSTARTAAEAASAFTRLLRGDVVDGAILLETLDLQPTAADDKPWVVIGYAAGAEVPTIHADDVGGARQAARHLIQLGHRRIGVISSQPRPFALEERLRGVREVLAAAGCPLDEGRLAVGDFSVESGERAGHQLLSDSEPPSAIFAMNDRMALGAMRAAASRGLHVPADLTVVGFDDIALATLLSPPLTTVRQPGFALGVAASATLFAMLAGQQPEPATVIPTELIIRGTSAPPQPERG